MEARVTTVTDSVTVEPNRPPIKTLPPEILHHVFSWLDPDELNPVSRVCRFFHDYISHNQSLHRAIYLNWFVSAGASSSAHTRPTARVAMVFNRTPCRINRLRALSWTGRPSCMILRSLTSCSTELARMPTSRQVSPLLICWLPNLANMRNHPSASSPFIRF